MIPFHGGKDTHRLILRYANVIWWRCPLRWRERLTTTFHPRTPPINLTMTCADVCVLVHMFPCTPAEPSSHVNYLSYLSSVSVSFKTLKHHFLPQQLKHLHGAAAAAAEAAARARSVV